MAATLHFFYLFFMFLGGGNGAAVSHPSGHHPSIHLTPPSSFFFNNPLPISHAHATRSNISDGDVSPTHQITLDL
jgi:hypothetical protein